MNLLPTSLNGSKSLSFVMRNLRYSVFLLLSLSYSASVASAQPTLSIVANSDVSDDQVFHLITTFQLDTSNLKGSMEALIKIKISTLQRRIENLTSLKTKWLKLAEQADETANQEQHESDALEEQLNTSVEDASKQSDDGILVFSTAGTETLYLTSQTERQRISWEIAAEEATLEQLKKIADQSRVPASTAVLEGKIRVAEIALRAAKDVLDNNLALKEKNIISSGDLRISQRQYETRVAELDIARAELKAQSELGRSSITDTVVKSSLNLAQLKARDQVLKVQLQRLAKAKHQITAVEKLRSDAATKRTRAQRYQDMAIDQQADIDKLESLTEALQAAIQPNSESQDQSKGSIPEKTSEEPTSDSK